VDLEGPQSVAVVGGHEDEGGVRPRLCSRGSARRGLGWYVQVPRYVLRDEVHKTRPRAS
jgi:hypothetical protein